MYAVVAGERTYLDLASIPSLTPRQTRALARVGPTDDRPLADDEVRGRPPSEPTLLTWRMSAAADLQRAPHTPGAVPPWESQREFPYCDLWPGRSEKQLGSARDKRWIVFVT